MVKDNLKILRKKRKLSQQRVADMLQIKRSTYSGWENGISEPNIAMLKKFALYHKITLDLLCK
jgi:transcriptional regulator with XRE-family HTH domain